MKPTIIYLRTSTEEQNPDNQLKDCVELVDRVGLKDYETIPEQLSGWKDIEREKLNLIKQSIERKQIKNLIVWDLDRLYRNRKKLISFFQFCKSYGCKIYSFRQDWLESLNKIQEPFNEIMFNLMLEIMGWLAEEESNKKSERTKNAVRRQTGEPTLSYKGNKWGRKPLSKKTISEILELHKKGLTIRDISGQVFYWDKNNNKKKVSISAVHKIIQQNKGNKQVV